MAKGLLQDALKRGKPFFLDENLMTQERLNEIFKETQAMTDEELFAPSSAPVEDENQSAEDIAQENVMEAQWDDQEGWTYNPKWANRNLMGSSARQQPIRKKKETGAYDANAAAENEKRYREAEKNITVEKLLANDVAQQNKLAIGLDKVALSKEEEKGLGDEQLMMLERFRAKENLFSIAFDRAKTDEERNDAKAKLDDVASRKKQWLALANAQNAAEENMWHKRVEKKWAADAKKEEASEEFKKSAWYSKALHYTGKFLATGAFDLLTGDEHAGGTPGLLPDTSSETASYQALLKMKKELEKPEASDMIKNIEEVSKPARDYASQKFNYYPLLDASYMSFVNPETTLYVPVPAEISKERFNAMSAAEKQALLKKYNDSKSVVDRADDIIEDLDSFVKGDDGVMGLLYGFGRNYREWGTAGMNGLLKSWQTAVIAHKGREGKELTDEEKAILGIEYLKQEVNGMNIYEGRGFQRTGDMVATSAVFIEQMMAGGSVARGITGAARSALEIGEKIAELNAIRGVAKEGASKALEIAAQEALKNGTKLTLKEAAALRSLQFVDKVVLEGASAAATAEMMPYTHTSANEKYIGPLQMVITVDGEKKILYSAAHRIAFMKEAKNRLTMIKEAKKALNPESPTFEEHFKALSNEEESIMRAMGTIYDPYNKDVKTIIKEVGYGNAHLYGLLEGFKEVVSETVVGGLASSGLKKLGWRGVNLGKAATAMSEMSIPDYITRGGKFLSKTIGTPYNYIQKKGGHLTEMMKLHGWSRGRIYHGLPSELIEEYAVQLAPVWDEHWKEKYAEQWNEMFTAQFNLDVLAQTMLMGAGFSAIQYGSHWWKKRTDEGYRENYEKSVEAKKELYELFKKIEKGVSNYDDAKKLMMSSKLRNFTDSDVMAEVAKLKGEGKHAEASKMVKGQFYSAVVRALETGTLENLRKSIEKGIGKVDAKDTALIEHMNFALNKVAQYEALSNKYEEHPNRTRLIQEELNKDIFKMHLDDIDAAIKSVDAVQQINDHLKIYNDLQRAKNDKHVDEAFDFNDIGKNSEGLMKFLIDAKDTEINRLLGLHKTREFAEVLYHRAILNIATEGDEKLAIKLRAGKLRERMEDVYRTSDVEKLDAIANNNSLEEEVREAAGKKRDAINRNAKITGDLKVAERNAKAEKRVKESSEKPNEIDEDVFEALNNLKESEDEVFRLGKEEKADDAAETENETPAKPNPVSDKAKGAMTKLLADIEKKIGGVPMFQDVLDRMIKTKSRDYVKTNYENLVSMWLAVTGKTEDFDDIYETEFAAEIVADEMSNDEMSNDDNKPKSRSESNKPPPAQGTSPATVEEGNKDNKGTEKDGQTKSDTQSNPPASPETTVDPVNPPDDNPPPSPPPAQAPVAPPTTNANTTPTPQETEEEENEEEEEEGDGTYEEDGDRRGTSGGMKLPVYGQNKGPRIDDAHWDLSMLQLLPVDDDPNSGKNNFLLDPEFRRELHIESREKPGVLRAQQIDDDGYVMPSSDTERLDVSLTDAAGKEHKIILKTPQGKITWGEVKKLVREQLKTEALYKQWVDQYIPVAVIYNGEKSGGKDMVISRIRDHQFYNPKNKNTKTKTARQRASNKRAAVRIRNLRRAAGNTGSAPIAVSINMFGQIHEIPKDKPLQTVAEQPGDNRLGVLTIDPKTGRLIVTVGRGEVIPQEQLINKLERFKKKNPGANAARNVMLTYSHTDADGKKIYMASYVFNEGKLNKEPRLTKDFPAPLQSTVKFATIAYMLIAADANGQPDVVAALEKKHGFKLAEAKELAKKIKETFNEGDNKAVGIETFKDLKTFIALFTTGVKAKGDTGKHLDAAVRSAEALDDFLTKVVPNLEIGFLTDRLGNKKSLQLIDEQGRLRSLNEKGEFDDNASAVNYEQTMRKFYKTAVITHNIKTIDGKTIPILDIEPVVEIEQINDAGGRVADATENSGEVQPPAEENNNTESDGTETGETGGEEGTGEEVGSDTGTDTGTESNPPPKEKTAEEKEAQAKAEQEKKLHHEAVAIYLAELTKRLKKGVSQSEAAKEAYSIMDKFVLDERMRMAEEDGSIPATTSENRRRLQPNDQYALERVIRAAVAERLAAALKYGKEVGLKEIYEVVAEETQRVIQEEIEARESLADSIDKALGVKEGRYSHDALEKIKDALNKKEAIEENLKKYFENGLSQSFASTPADGSINFRNQLFAECGLELQLAFFGIPIKDENSGRPELNHMGMPMHYTPDQVFDRLLDATSAVNSNLAAILSELDARYQLASRGKAHDDFYNTLRNKVMLMSEKAQNQLMHLLGIKKVAVREIHIVPTQLMRDKNGKIMRDKNGNTLFTDANVVSYDADKNKSSGSVFAEMWDMLQKRIAASDDEEKDAVYRELNNLLNSQTEDSKKIRGVLEKLGLGAIDEATLAKALELGAVNPVYALHSKKGLLRRLARVFKESRKKENDKKISAALNEFSESLRALVRLQTLMKETAVLTEVEVEAETAAEEPSQDNNNDSNPPEGAEDNNNDDNPEPPQTAGGGQGTEGAGAGTEGQDTTGQEQNNNNNTGGGEIKPGENKTANYVAPTELHDAIYRLLTDPDYVKALRKSAYAKDNYLLQFLEMKGVDELRQAMASPFYVKGGDADALASRMTTLFSLFMDEKAASLGKQLKGFEGIKFKMAAVPMSSSLEPGKTFFVPMPVLDLASDQITDKKGEIEIAPKVMDLLSQQLFESELNRIIEAYSVDSGIKGYNISAKCFHHLVSFNAIEIEVGTYKMNIHEVLSKSKGNISNEIRKRLVEKAKEKIRELIQAETDASLREGTNLNWRVVNGIIDINPVVSGSLSEVGFYNENAQYLERKTQGMSLGFIDKHKQEIPDEYKRLRFAMAEYNINYLLAQVAKQQVFYGDPAFTSGISVETSRDAKTGVVAYNVDVEDLRKMADGVAAGNKKREQALTLSGRKLANSDNDASKFNNDAVLITFKGDGVKGVYCSWRFFIESLEREGKLSSAEKASITKAIEDGSITEEEINRLKGLTSKEMNYARMETTHDTLLNRPFSMTGEWIPLFPSSDSAYKDSSHEGMREALEKKEKELGVHVLMTDKATENIGGLDSDLTIQDFIKGKDASMATTRLHKSGFKNRKPSVRKRTPKATPDLDFTEQKIREATNTDSDAISPFSDGFQQKEAFADSGGNAAAKTYEAFLELARIVKSLPKDAVPKLPNFEERIGELTSNGTLGNTKTLDGRRDILEALSESVSAAKKNPFDDARNDNEHTADVYALMTLLGFDGSLEKVDGEVLHIPSLFMAQPVIKRYVELRRSSINNGSYDAKDIDMSIMLHIANEYGLDTKFNQEFDYVEFTAGSLAKMLDEKTAKKYPKEQYAILRQFLRFKDQAKSLKRMLPYKGGSPAATVQKAMEMEYSFDFQQGFGAEPSLSSIVGTPSEEEKEGAIKIGSYWWTPSGDSMRASLVKLKNDMDALDAKFPYSSTTVDNILTSILSAANISPLDDSPAAIRFKQSILDDFINYIDVVNNVNTKDINKVAKRLFDGEHPLVKIISGLQKKGGVVAANSLIRNLQVVYNPRKRVYSLKIKKGASLEDVKQGLKELKKTSSSVGYSGTAEEITGKSLAEDLGLYAVLSADPSLKALYPPDSPKKTAMINKLRSEKDNDADANEALEKAYVRNYFQRNPLLANVILKSKLETATKDQSPSPYVYVAREKQLYEYSASGGEGKYVSIPVLDSSAFRQRENGYVKSQWEKPVLIRAGLEKELSPVFDAEDELDANGDYVYKTNVKIIETNPYLDAEGNIPQAGVYKGENSFFGNRAGDWNKIKTVKELFALDELQRDRLPKEYRFVYDYLFPLMKDYEIDPTRHRSRTELPILFGEYEWRKKDGVLSEDIFFNKYLNGLYSEYDYEEAVREFQDVIFEEVIHGLTALALRKHVELDKHRRPTGYVDEKPPAFATMIVDMYNAAKVIIPPGTSQSNGGYYSTNIFEFMAGMFVSPIYRQKLEADKEGFTDRFGRAIKGAIASSLKDADINIKEDYKREFYKAIVELVKNFTGEKRYDPAEEKRKILADAIIAHEHKLKKITHELSSFGIDEEFVELLTSGDKEKSDSVPELADAKIREYVKEYKIEEEGAARIREKIYLLLGEIMDESKALKRLKFLNKSFENPATTDERIKQLNGLIEEQAAKGKAAKAEVDALLEQMKTLGATGDLRKIVSAYRKRGKTDDDYNEYAAAGRIAHFMSVAMLKEMSPISPKISYEIRRRLDKIEELELELRLSTLMLADYRKVLKMEEKDRKVEEEKRQARVIDEGQALKNMEEEESDESADFESIEKEVLGVRNLEDLFKLDALQYDKLPPDLQNLYNQLIPHLPKDFPIRFIPSGATEHMQSGVAGYYSFALDAVFINKSTIELITNIWQGRTQGRLDNITRFQRIIFEEIIHALTMRQLDEHVNIHNNYEWTYKNDNPPEFIKSIVELYQRARIYVPYNPKRDIDTLFDYSYHSKNIYEFIAGVLTHPEYRERLENYDDGFFDKFLRALKSLWLYLNNLNAKPFSKKDIERGQQAMVDLVKNTVVNKSYYDDYLKNNKDFERDERDILDNKSANNSLSDEQIAASDKLEKQLLAIRTIKDLFKLDALQYDKLPKDLQALYKRFIVPLGNRFEVRFSPTNGKLKNMRHGLIGYYDDKTNAVFMNTIWGNARLSSVLLGYKNPANYSYEKLIDFFQRSVFEELIHAATSVKFQEHVSVYKDGTWEYKSKNTPEFAKAIIELYEKARVYLPFDPKNDVSYHSMNPIEFIAGMIVHPEYREKLENYDNGFIKKFLRALKSLLLYLKGISAKPISKEDVEKAHQAVIDLVEKTPYYRLPMLIRGTDEAELLLENVPGLVPIVGYENYRKAPNNITESRKLPKLECE